MHWKNQPVLVFPLRFCGRVGGVALRDQPAGELVRGQVGGRRQPGRQQVAAGGVPVAEPRGGRGTGRRQRQGPDRGVAAPGIGQAGIDAPVAAQLGVVGERFAHALATGVVGRGHGRVEGPVEKAAERAQAVRGVAHQILVADAVLARGGHAGEEVQNVVVGALPGGLGQLGGANSPGWPARITRSRVEPERGGQSRNTAGPQRRCGWTSVLSRARRRSMKRRSAAGRSAVGSVIDGMGSSLRLAIAGSLREAAAPPP